MEHTAREAALAVLRPIADPEVLADIHYLEERGYVWVYDDLGIAGLVRPGSSAARVIVYLEHGDFEDDLCEGVEE